MPQLLMVIFTFFFSLRVLLNDALSCWGCGYSVVDEWM